MNAAFSCRTVLVASSNASPNFAAQGLSVDRGAMCGPIWSVKHAKSTPTIKPPFLDARPSGPDGTASAAGGSQKNVLGCSTWNNRLSSQATCSRTEVSSRCGSGGRLAPGGVWGTSRPAHKLFSIHDIIIFRLCKENAACVADARTPIPGQHCGGVWKIGGRAAEQGLVNIFLGWFHGRRQRMGGQARQLCYEGQPRQQGVAAQTQRGGVQTFGGHRGETDRRALVQSRSSAVKRTRKPSAPVQEEPELQAGLREYLAQARRNR